MNNMKMQELVVLKKLYEMIDELDEIQEMDFVQENEDLMWEIGEAFGSIQNAIDIIELNKDYNELKGETE